MFNLPSEHKTFVGYTIGDGTTESKAYVFEQDSQKANYYGYQRPNTQNNGELPLRRTSNEYAFLDSGVTIIEHILHTPPNKGVDTPLEQLPCLFVNGLYSQLHTEHSLTKNKTFQSRHDIRLELKRIDQPILVCISPNDEYNATPVSITCTVRGGANSNLVYKRTINGMQLERTHYGTNHAFLIPPILGTASCNKWFSYLSEEKTISDTAAANPAESGGGEDGTRPSTPPTTAKTPPSTPPRTAKTPPSTAPTTAKTPHSTPPRTAKTPPSTPPTTAKTPHSTPARPKSLYSSEQQSSPPPLNRNSIRYDQDSSENIDVSEDEYQSPVEPQVLDDLTRALNDMIVSRKNPSSEEVAEKLKTMTIGTAFSSEKLHELKLRAFEPKETSLGQFVDIGTSGDSSSSDKKKSELTLEEALEIMKVNFKNINKCVDIDLTIIWNNDYDSSSQEDKNYSQTIKIRLEGSLEILETADNLNVMMLAKTGLMLPKTIRVPGMTPEHMFEDESGHRSYSKWPEPDTTTYGSNYMQDTTTNGSKYMQDTSANAISMSGLFVETRLQHHRIHIIKQYETSASKSTADSSFDVDGDLDDDEYTNREDLLKVPFRQMINDTLQKMLVLKPYLLTRLYPFLLIRRVHNKNTDSFTKVNDKHIFTSSIFISKDARMHCLRNFFYLQGVPQSQSMSVDQAFFKTKRCKSLASDDLVCVSFLSSVYIEHYLRYLNDLGQSPESSFALNVQQLAARTTFDATVRTCSLINKSLIWRVAQKRLAFTSSSDGHSLDFSVYDLSYFSYEGWHALLFFRSHPIWLALEQMPYQTNMSNPKWNAYYQADLLRRACTRLMTMVKTMNLCELPVLTILRLQEMSLPRSHVDGALAVAHYAAILSNMQRQVNESNKHTRSLTQVAQDRKLAVEANIVKWKRAYECLKSNQDEGADMKILKPRLQRAISCILMQNQILRLKNEKTDIDKLRARLHIKDNFTNMWRMRTNYSLHRKASGQHSYYYSTEKFGTVLKDEQSTHISQTYVLPWGFDMHLNNDNDVLKQTNLQVGSLGVELAAVKEYLSKSLETKSKTEPAEDNYVYHLSIRPIYATYADSLQSKVPPLSHIDASLQDCLDVQMSTRFLHGHSNSISGCLQAVATFSNYSTRRMEDKKHQQTHTQTDEHHTTMPDLMMQHVATNMLWDAERIAQLLRIALHCFEAADVHKIHVHIDTYEQFLPKIELALCIAIGMIGSTSGISVVRSNNNIFEERHKNFRSETSSYIFEKIEKTNLFNNVLKLMETTLMCDHNSDKEMSVTTVYELCLLFTGLLK